MKLNYKWPLTMLASLSILLPMSAFAEDQKLDATKQQTNKERGRHGTEVAQPGATHVSPASIRRSRSENVQNESRVKTVQRSTVSPMVSPSLQPSRFGRSQRTESTQTIIQPENRKSLQPSGRFGSSQHNRTYRSSNQRTYSKSNNYGGLWFSENIHSDWKRDRTHYWNRHNYRWYEGGWLIIDGGFSPYGFNTGSITSNVQMRLANQGYYSGLIDGDFGPRTRNAIAEYQSDHSLRITGQINHPLLQSLQLE